MSLHDQRQVIKMRLRNYAIFNCSDININLERNLPLVAQVLVEEMKKLGYFKYDKYRELYNLHVYDINGGMKRFTYLILGPLIHSHRFVSRRVDGYGEFDYMFSFCDNESQNTILRLGRKIFVKGEMDRNRVLVNSKTGNTRVLNVEQGHNPELTTESIHGVVLMLASYQVLVKTRVLFEKKPMKRSSVFKTAVANM